ncbi:MAG: cobalamin B12-binding domain-containing protein, partial [Bacteroidetes bacterium]|nr:cobalamin B12-binding domain-containing protein [Bacteroidota bacterium]
MNYPEHLEAFLQCLHSGDRRRCFDRVREWEEQGIPNEDLYSDILIPALVRFGEDWERNEQGVVEEHVATQIVRHILAHKAVTLVPRRTRNHSAMVGCVPDEQHDLASLIMANVLEEDGWRVFHYGTSVPKYDLLQALRRRQPDLLCLTTKSISGLDGTLRLLSELRAELPEMKIMLGGGLTPHLRALLSPHVDVIADT